MSSLANALSKQLYGNSFDFLNEMLGADLVASIPCVTVKQDYDYPQPWKSASDLPADVVKGVLPSGRPFLAMRYVITQTNQIGYEIFFQRYSQKQPPAVRIATPLGDAIDISLKVTKASSLSKHWSSSDHGCCGHAVYNGGGMNEKHFAMIKSILQGEPLDKTGGKYLQLYASRFKHEKK